MRDQCSLFFPMASLSDDEIRCKIQLKYSNADASEQWHSYKDRRCGNYTQPLAVRTSAQAQTHNYYTITRTHTSYSEALLFGWSELVYQSKPGPALMCDLFHFSHAA